MDNEIFYMVFIEGGNSPTHRHLTLKSAEDECRRLVKKTGSKGIILQSVKSIQLMPEFLETDHERSIPY